MGNSQFAGEGVAGGGGAQKIIKSALEGAYAMRFIERAINLRDGKRDNDAMHTYACMHLVYNIRNLLPGKVNVSRVLLMLLLHDRVELVCGDTPLFSKDSESQEGEHRAAELVFKDDRESLELWKEFAAGETEDAITANLADALEGAFSIFYSEDSTWKNDRVTYERALRRSGKILRHEHILSSYLRGLYAEAQARGLFYKEVACV